MGRTNPRRRSGYGLHLQVRAPTRTMRRLPFVALERFSKGFFLCYIGENRDLLVFTHLLMGRRVCRVGLMPRRFAR